MLRTQHHATCRVARGRFPQSPSNSASSAHDSPHPTERTATMHMPQVLVVAVRFKSQEGAVSAPGQQGTQAAFRAEEGFP
jgi:hypothetical protein